MRMFLASSTGGTEPQRLHVQPLFQNVLRTARQDATDDALSVVRVVVGDVVRPSRAPRRRRRRGFLGRHDDRVVSVVAGWLASCSMGVLLAASDGRGARFSAYELRHYNSDRTVREANLAMFDLSRSVLSSLRTTSLAESARGFSRRANPKQNTNDVMTCKTAIFPSFSWRAKKGRRTKFSLVAFSSRTNNATTARVWCQKGKDHHEALCCCCCDTLVHRRGLRVGSVNR